MKPFLNRQVSHLSVAGAIYDGYTTEDAIWRNTRLVIKSHGNLHKVLKSMIENDQIILATGTYCLSDEAETYIKTRRDIEVVNNPAPARTAPSFKPLDWRKYGISSAGTRGDAAREISFVTISGSPVGHSYREL